MNEKLRGNVGIFHQVWAPQEVSDRQCLEETMSDVRLADRLGYPSFAFGEHHFGRDKAMYGRCPIPEYLIARLAAETTQIHLGTAVKVLPFDSATRTAEGISLLDILTGGRALYGIGMGVRTDPNAPTHDRGELFRQQLKELSAYLRLDTSDGRQMLTPVPDRDLSDLLWVAARENESIDAAAELNLNFVVGQAEKGVQQRTYVDRYRASGGTAMTKGARMVLVGETDREAWEYVEKPATRAFNGMKNGRYYQEAIARGLVPDDEPTDIEDMLRRIEFLAGSPATVAEGLLRYMDEAAVDRVDIMVHAPGVSHDAVVRSIELFASEIAPQMATRQMPSMIAA